MAEIKEICRLDYLYGTLATAYKGVITSLAAKAFCMSQQSSSVTITGTILSMPDGNYESSLMRDGNELARNEIRGGLFQFTVNESLIMEARNLQIDVIQKGRHVGTFLLKRENSDEFYVSAVELSDELRDFKPHILLAYIQDKPGLLKRAEGIVSIIISPKRDWIKLSEDINSFAGDLYWADPLAFNAWYPVFTRWSAKSAVTSSKPNLGRTTANFLKLAELPLDHINTLKSEPLLQLWLDMLQSSGIDLSFNPDQIANIIEHINKTFPAIDIKPALLLLLRFFRQRIANAPIVSAEIMSHMHNSTAMISFTALNKYSNDSKAATMVLVDAAESSLVKNDIRAALQQFQEIIALIPDESELIELLFSIVEKYLNTKSASIAIDILKYILGTIPNLSHDIARRACINSARFIESFIEMHMTDACLSIFNVLNHSSEELIDNILLRPEVASAVIRSGDSGLMGHYESIIKKLRVPVPRILGFSGDTWAELVDPKHIDRLSRLLAVLGVSGGGFHELMIGLLCNIYVSGVFIQDDRLFQRDVSTYLNSAALTNNYLINYILLKRLPVYFNEVGAVNTIRDDTTEIDSWANDMTLYFLRKQVHVNSSNHNIRLVESIINAWTFNDRSFLSGTVPDDVYEKADMKLIDKYSQAIRPLFTTLKILDAEGLHLDRLLALSAEEIEQTLSDLNHSSVGLTDEIFRKTALLCRIYREIVKKYALFGGAVMNSDAAYKPSVDIDKIWALRKVVLSSDKTAPEESIYYKRHIAFGIPSVLGTYHEAKFDAFSEILKIENRMTLYFESLISEVEKMQTDPTVDDIERYIYCLDIMNELCRSHGMENFQISEAIAIIKSNHLYIAQFTDLLRVIQKELIWMVDSLARKIHAPLKEVIQSAPKEDLTRYLKMADTDKADYVEKVFDVIMRDIISSIAGFTEMDRLLEAIIKKSHSSLDSSGDILINTFDGNLLNAAPFYDLSTLSNLSAMQLAPAIGGKAKNLVYLINGKLQVPYAVVFPAQNTFKHREYTESAEFIDSVRLAVQNIERATGLVYGDPQRPLFLSVRSGSYMSMPGILSSILYCGMNANTLDGFISFYGDPLLALDSYRRFIDHYAKVVVGMDDEIFGKINSDMLKRRSASKMTDLSSDDMSDIITLYMKEITARGLTVPDDVYMQLREAVNAVYGSWYGERALQFRNAMHISEHWGTAVMIMQMVSGNRQGSGASVFFTRTPSSMANGLYGDTRESATGDDLVYGGLISRPLSKAQAIDGQKSLEETDPELFAMHLDLSYKIERSMGGLPQEVEATYVLDSKGNRTIYALQTRRMESHRGFTKHFQDICLMESSIIGRGIGVHGGALSGIATFSSSTEKVDSIRKKTGLPVIILRKTSSTDDVSLMSHIDGIVTSTGGATSHAAILAGKFDLSAVVGCADMEILDNEAGQQFARISGYIVTEESPLSIDGSTGLVYSGVCSFITESD
ncbi:MAG TPA: PEP/pyruvate-binding domain-containing protein [Dissulfurispiraceae bacterium]|nr:PEP/pyruvate-binding domain-containing protein [Dissulfurispiraceae bacterium]